MATFFERLQHYCSQHKKEHLNHNEKCDLGRKINKKYFSLNYNTNQWSMCRSVEADGVFRVINYPEFFTSEIDAFIASEYAEKEKPPPPKKRKRIPAKTGPIKEFSVKPSLGQIEGQS